MFNNNDDFQPRVLFPDEMENWDQDDDMDDLPELDDFPDLEEDIILIIPPFAGETVRDVLNRGDILPPRLHRTLGLISCKVEGCDNETDNDCGICRECHAINPTPNFPCSYFR
jgi:hypothetical protein